MVNLKALSGNIDIFTHLKLCFATIKKYFVEFESEQYAEIENLIPVWRMNEKAGNGAS